MTQFRGQNKTASNNINININLSMKDSIRPSGKKIQNSIKIGTSSMENKRMTLLTQRLKDKKRDLESYHEQDETEYIKAKRTVYTTKKQRPKTLKNTPEQMITAFSTTKARAKYASKDVKQPKETPIKANKPKQGDVFSKQKRTISNQKLKSRRNSKNGISSSVQNLRKVKINRSPTKSDSRKSNSKSRSNSNQKCQIIKKKEKISLEVPTSKSSSKQRLQPFVEADKNTKAKNKFNPKARDDSFVNKPPQQKKQIGKKTIIDHHILDAGFKIPNQKLPRRTHSTLVVKNTQKEQYQSPISRKKINQSAIKIQKTWRGYWIRKKLLNQLQSFKSKNLYINSLISGNKKQFWNDCSVNSIKFINVDIEDSFTDQPLEPPLDLLNAEQVISVQNSVDDLNPFERLIKMSQEVGDQKLARQLRNMAQNLMKQDLEKKKIIRQNRQLKNDIIQLKQESINCNHLPMPLVEPSLSVDDQQKFENPIIVMPIKVEKNKAAIQTKQKSSKGIIQKNILKNQQVLEVQKVDVAFSISKEPVQYYSAKNQLSAEDALQKRNLIEQLKSFKGQSDNMMRVFKKQQTIPKNQQKKRDETKQIKKSFNKKQEQKKDHNQNKPLFQYDKHGMVVDYQMSNESSDSEQFKEAIKKIQEKTKRNTDEVNNFMSKEKQKQKGKDEELKRPLEEIQQIINVIQPSSQEHSQDSDAPQQSLDSISNIQQKLSHQKKGFETNLNFVKEYCIGLCQYIRSNEEVKKKFKLEFLKPLKIDLVQFMKSYRRTIDGQYNNEFNSFKSDYRYPYFKETAPSEGLIKKETFDKFNETVLTLKRNTPNADPLDIELETIHLQNLLDVFNQSLNYERPSGIYGEALPWAPKVKHLKNINGNFQQDGGNQNVNGEQYSKQNQKFDQLFGVSIARVIQWGSSLCGFIPQALDIDVNIQIDDQYINHIKQTRMALMLQKTLAEDESKMLEFTDVETEVKLEIATKLFEDLLSQVFEQLANTRLQTSFQYLD